MSSAADAPKLKKEVGTFLLFFGTILTAAGYWAYSDLKGNPHDLFGFTRNLALGVPLLLLGALHLIAGVLLFATSGRIWALVGAIASTLVALFYFLFCVAASGTVPLTIISALVVVIPVGVWIRTRVFLRSLAPK